MLEILGKTNIDFMGKRTIAFAFSGAMVLLGLIAVVQIARGAANLGIDFAGGTAVQLKFDQPIRIDEARKVLEANGLGNAELQEFGQDNKLLIRVKTSTTIEEKTAETVVDVFKTKFASNLASRYLSEDVPTGLVPIAALGEAAGVATSLTRLLIELASRVHGVDHWTTGRTLARMGLAGMDAAAIRHVAEEEFGPS